MKTYFEDNRNDHTINFLLNVTFNNTLLPETLNTAGNLPSADATAAVSCPAGSGIYHRLCLCSHTGKAENIVKKREVLRR